MTGLLAFHRLAAARGDGLLPELRALLEYREQLQGTDPGVVSLDGRRPDGMVQAGPSPRGGEALFVPGNVTRFEPAAKAQAQAGRRKAEG